MARTDPLPDTARPMWNELGRVRAVVRAWTRFEPIVGSAGVPGGRPGDGVRAPRRARDRDACGRSDQHELQGHDPCRPVRRPHLRQGLRAPRDRPRERGSQHDCRRGGGRRCPRGRGVAGARRPCPRVPRRRGDGRREAAARRPARVGRGGMPAPPSWRAVSFATSTCSRSSVRMCGSAPSAAFDFPSGTTSSSRGFERSRRRWPS